MPTSWNLKTLILLLGATLLILFVFFIWPMEVTVIGTGQVEVPVEEAVIAMTVTDINTDANVAAQNLQTKLSAIQTTLVQNGADASDITRSQVRIVPASTVVPGTQGYAAVSAIGGPVTNLTNLSSLTASLYSQGATLVETPVLRNDSEKDMARNALNEAISDARSQAAAIGRRHLRFFKHTISITQAPATDVATATQTGTAERNDSGFSLLNNNDEDIVPSEDTITLTRTVQATFRLW